jgi:NAD(P)-dependent dehydrogenase (short-subunit alcohol dehydrogenase family)
MEREQPMPEPVPGSTPPGEGVPPHRRFSLDERVAVITGAAGGIGRAIASGLAGAGARLVLGDREESELASARAALPVREDSVCYQPGDLSVAEDRRALVDLAVQRFGRIDVLVNCAGVNRREPIDEVERATFTRLMSVDLEAPYFLSQLVAREMRRQGGGSIIHVGSINGAVGIPGVSVYAAAKAGLSQLARGMAVEWAPDGIRVNCLAPGFTRTLLLAPVLDDPVRAAWIRERTPMRRVAEPEELVGACLLFASDAGSFITGQTLYVDGGFLAGSSWDQ